MNKKYYTTILLLFLGISLQAQLDSIQNSIKSVEAQVFSAEIENGEIIKKPYSSSFFLETYKIKLSCSCNKEYNTNGQLTKIYYPKSQIEYNIVYNERDDLSKIIYSDKEKKDSLVMEIVYDFKGNFEKVITDEFNNMRPDWLSEIGEGEYFHYLNEEHVNFYLTTNDSINQIKINDFKNLKIETNHLYNLLDNEERIVFQRKLTVEDFYGDNLLFKRLDSTFINTEYKYVENKIKEKNSIYRPNRENIGGFKSLKYEYAYTNDGKLKEVVETAEYFPLKSGIANFKAKTLISKEVYEYLDDDTKHIVYFFDHNNKLEKKWIGIYTINGVIKQETLEIMNRKRVFKYNKRGHLISYVFLNKKNKKKMDMRLDYKYNIQGDWIQRVHFDVLKNKPRYVEERIIEYY